MQKSRKKETYYAKEIWKEIGSAVMTLYIFLITVVQPLVHRTYTTIGTDKYFCFRYSVLGILLIGVPVFLAYLIAKPHSKNIRNWQEDWSVTDFLALGYGIVVCISFLCSRYQEEAFWGNQDGWYMGFVTQVSVIAIYFLLSRMWKPNQGSLYFFLGTAVFVFVIGILNRFSVYPLSLKEVTPSFISTLGNINWYCGYWSVAFPIGLVWFWNMAGSVSKDSRGKWEEICGGIFVIIGFATGVTQGSNSGFLALGVMMIALFGMSVSDGYRMQRFWLICVMLCAACQGIHVIRMIAPEAINYTDALMDITTDTNVTLYIGIVTGLIYELVRMANAKKKYSVKVFRICNVVLLGGVLAVIVLYVALLVSNSLYPGSIGKLSEDQSFIFNEKWGNKRGIIWWSGIQIFASQNFLGKWIGVGPDAFCAYTYSDACAVAEKVIAVFGTSKLTNAHNEWLTVLVNTGLLGLFTYAGFIISAIIRFMKGGRAGNPALYLWGLSVLSYTAHNMVSFQQALNFPLVMLVLGVGECMMRSARNPGRM